MTHREWHPHWHTRAGRRHVCKRRCFPTFFFFPFHVTLFNILLQLNSFEEKMWRDVTSGTAAVTERRLLALPRGTGGRRESEWDWWLSVLRSGSCCCFLAGAAARAGSPSAGWTSTQCRSWSLRLDEASRGSDVNGAFDVTPRWQGHAAPPAPLAASAQPRASSGPGFLCSPPVSSSGWA